MDIIFLGVVGALIATNQPLAGSNRTAPATNRPAAAVANGESAEKEYENLLDADDEAQGEVDKWIQENQQFAAKGTGLPAAELNRRIRERFEPIKKGYEDFLKRHPNHVRARIAYGSFLGDIGDEDGAQGQWEKALATDPKNPAVYNNLANLYGHSGPVKKAFEYYAKAIELNPLEPVYYHNFGTTVFLFRKDAKEYYKINEEQVFAKALDLYSNAMRLDPHNFPLASDVAQTYYGIMPLRADEALRAWTNALNLAHDEPEREGVYIHLARLKILAGRFDEARGHLSSVTNEMYIEMRDRISRNLKERENAAKGTNNAALNPETKP